MKGAPMSESQPAPSQRADNYRNILNSTALMGAASIVAMAFALVRVKALAVLLGPTGIGLVALYSSIADVAVAVAGMGVSQSGVRQIALAEGSGNAGSIAATMRTLARTSLVLGLIGGLGMLVLAVPAAMLTFGSAEYAAAVAALGFVVLIRVVTGGQTALLQGARRIADIAKLNVIGAVAGVATTVPLVLIWREAAIVPALILTAATTWVAAEFFRRRVPGIRTFPARAQPGAAVDLLRLGFAFMVSGFLTMGAAYAVRIIVLHELGVNAAGLYQAAWALAGLYVGLVLQAMATDFYPRLTAAADDNATVNRLVNEQTEVSLLLAAPGVLATITFAHLAMLAFYSPEFAPAASLLRWLCLGMMLRVVAWPMGFIILAKGWQRIFIAVEVAATIVHVAGTAILVPFVGVDGAGMAFAALYLGHSVLVYAIARRFCGFSFSPRNRRLILLFGGASAVAFTGFLGLPFWWATAVGTAISCATGVLAIHELRHMVAGSLLPTWLRGWLAWR